MHARAQEEGGGADERAEDAAHEDALWDGDAVGDYLYDHSLGEDDAAFQYGFEDDENHRDWQDNQYFQDWVRFCRHTQVGQRGVSRALTDTHISKG